MQIPDASSRPLEYRDALLALVADQDPVGVMNATERATSDALAESTPGSMEPTTSPPASGRQAKCLVTSSTSRSSMASAGALF